MLVALGLAAGGALQSATGFGFALIASPVLVGAYGGEQGISTLTVLSILLNLMTLVTERRRPDGDWRRGSRLILWYVPGSFLGAVLLEVASATVLEIAIAAGVTVAILTRVTPNVGELRLAAAPAGLLGGVFGTSTGVSGPPFIVHLLGEGLPPARMRDTLAGIFLATAVIALGTLAVVGVFSLPGDLLWLALAMAAGQVAGRRVFARLSPVGYERLVLATMAAAVASTLILLVA